ncbi:hypothetical protein MBANPS3_001548 [Mucor bainieri]
MLESKCDVVVKDSTAEWSEAIYTVFLSTTKFEEANLIIEGDLADVLKDWSPQEWENQRRLVQFFRKQEGNAVTCRFETFHLPAEKAKQPDMSKVIVVSCIYWKDKNEYFVTSVDCIYLLEHLIGVKFSVEEKNRIRRWTIGNTSMTNWQKTKLLVFWQHLLLVRSELQRSPNRILGMNNIIDVSDTSEGSHIDMFTAKAQKAIQELFANDEWDEGLRNSCEIPEEIIDKFSKEQGDDQFLAKVSKEVEQANMDKVIKRIYVIILVSMIYDKDLYQENGQFSEADQAAKQVCIPFIVTQGLETDAYCLQLQMCSSVKDIITRRPRSSKSLHRYNQETIKMDSFFTRQLWVDPYEGESSDAKEEV